MFTNRRIWQLHEELEALKVPHPKGCICKYCTGIGIDWFSTDEEIRPEVIQILSTGE